MKNSTIAFSVIALVALSLVGAGYAVTYYGVTETSSTLGFDEYAIYITNADETTQISTPITVAGPTYTKVDDSFTASDGHTTVDTSTVTVSAGAVSPSSTYKLKIDAPAGMGLSVRAKIVMDDARTWAFINSIVITAGNSNTVTWQPTGSTWTEQSQLFSSFNAGTYNLSITVNYKATEFTDIHTDVDDFNFMTIGMKLILALADDDPVPQS